MIEPAQLAHLTPAKRAEIIYAQARSEVNAKLWQMALGGNGEDRSALVDTAFGTGGGQGVNLGSLIALLTGRQEEPVSEIAVQEPDVPAIVPAEPKMFAQRVGSELVPSTDLGRNSHFQPVIEEAARRVGMPASALAAIVDAEAGKSKGGEWNPFSRNPRSSAAGLGQFLSGTWISEAQKSGNWLNNVARQNGWLDSQGKVLPGARHQLLALRYDPKASIEATADYARNNMAYLEKSGVRIGESADAISHVAYIAHHLGVGDAVKFMRNGIPEGRARQLLAAQIGVNKAAERIGAAGSATLAHREWLNGYVSRQVRPQRFSSLA